MGISSVVSRSLRVAYLFAIVLIIAIHYNSRIATPDAPVDQGNYLVQEFITNGIARVAVPLYAFSAGFFFFLSYRDVNSYLKNLKKRTRTLLVPYLVVSAAMSIALLILRVLVKRNCDLHLLDLLGEILFHPRAAQLWFLRDLLLLVIIAPGIRFLAKALRGTFVLVLFGFWLFDLQVLPKLFGFYLLNIETLFFFTLGCLCTDHIEMLERIVSLRSRWVIGAACAWLALIAGRIVLDPSLDIWYVKEYTMPSLLLYKAAILVGTPLLLRLSAYPLFDAKLVMVLSGYSFFAYLFHDYPLSIPLSAFTGMVVERQYAFYLSFPLATIVVFSLARVCEQHLGAIYRLVTGDRGSGKVAARG